MAVGALISRTEVLEMAKRIARIVVYAGVISILLGAAAPSAHAYIDPGSSSYVIQILIGAFAAGGLAIATFWRRIRLFLGRVFGRDKAETADDSTPRTPDASDAS
jgi:hypothetical protein